MSKDQNSFEKGRLQTSLMSATDERLMKDLESGKLDQITAKAYLDQ